MPRPCTRRHALRLGGVLAGIAVAGCLDGETTELPVGESTTLSGTNDVAVTDVWVQQSVVQLYAGAHVGAFAEPNTQIVLAHATEDLRYGDFALDVDGERHPATGDLMRNHVDNVRVQGRDTEPLLLGWTVPKPLDAETVTVVYGGDTTIRWTAPDRVAATLADPPLLTFREFSTPDAVAPEETFELSVTVENTGGTDGTFRASLGRDDQSAQPVFRLDVPAGESATHVKRRSVLGEVDSVPYRLDWGLGWRVQTVTVET